MAKSATGGEELAIARGIPLEDEPGLGPLTLPGFLREIRDRHGPNEALAMYRDGRETLRWTYDDLWDRSLQVAKAVIASGTGKETRVGILMTNRLEYLSQPSSASALAGGTVVPLSTFSTAARARILLIKASGCSMLLLERQVRHRRISRQILCELEPRIATREARRAVFSQKFPFLRYASAMDGDGPTGARSRAGSNFSRVAQAIPRPQIDAAPPPSIPPIRPSLFFSSGSTGKPKGILNAHRGINIQLWRWPRITSSSRSTACAAGRRTASSGPAIWP